MSALKLRAVSLELEVDVSRLEELRGIRVAADGSVAIGAASTVGQRAVPWLAREQIANVLGTARSIATAA